MRTHAIDCDLPPDCSCLPGVMPPPMVGVMTPHNYTPEELRALKTDDGMRDLRRAAEVVACPQCQAPIGEPCSYKGAKIDDETGETVGVQTFQRAAHNERIAVYTEGRIYGHTLNKRPGYGTGRIGDLPSGRKR